MNEAFARRALRPIAFWTGAAAIVYGVGLHLLMFSRMADMDYNMAGMPVDGTMIAGMIAVVAGLAVAAFGLIPPPAGVRERAAAVRASAPASSTRLTRAQAVTLSALAFALIIDVMKPATLAFVVPGMMREYHIAKSAIALLPLVALSGTMIGSVVWGVLGDRIGRRGTIVFAALMFMATSICGTMPSFAWNLGMCFIMGMSAGGLVPVAFAVLAETLPERRRRFFLVLFGGFGSVGGYVAASSLALVLEPHFGWRVLWLAGLPTGLMLVALSRLIPESPLFRSAARAAPAAARNGTRAGVSAVSVWLNVCAFAWSTINFGFIFWLPTNFRELGFGVSLADGLLVKSALFSFVSTPLIALLYQRLDSRTAIVGLGAVQGALLLAFAAFGRRPEAFNYTALIVLIAGLLVAANGFICVLLPFAAERFPTRVRATGTGMVAGSSKLGGLLSLAIAKLGFVPTLALSGVCSGALILISATGLMGALLRGRRS